MPISMYQLTFVFLHVCAQTKEHQPPLAEAHPGVQLYQRSIKEKVSRQRVNASLVINAYDCGPLSEYSSVIRHVLSWRDCVYVITIDLTKSKDDQKADLDAAIFFLLANVSVMHHPQCPFLVVGTKKKKVSRFNAMDSERLFEEYESSEHLNIDSFQYILLDVEDPSSSDSAVFCKTVFDLARVATREQKSIIPLVTVIKEHRQRLPCVCTVREVRFYCGSYSFCVLFHMLELFSVFIQDCFRFLIQFASAWTICIMLVSSLISVRPPCSLLILRACFGFFLCSTPPGKTWSGLRDIPLLLPNRSFV